MINHNKHKEELKNLDKIFEQKRNNILNNFLCKASINEHIQPFSKEKQEYVMSNYFSESYLIQEGKDNETTFVPRFQLDKFSHPIFAKFPPNKELRYNKDLIILAMKYGMIIQIQYRGAGDNFIQGRTRVIYPMCVGTSSKGKPLLRVYHLKGWSHSENSNTEMVWRLFRTDRILSMSFTGMFFRLAPEGYNAKDKGMRGGIDYAVNLKEVKNNQQKLVTDGAIQNKKQVTIDSEVDKTTVIEIQTTNSILDLNRPFKNPNIDEKNIDQLRLTFLKSTTGNKYLCIMGAIGKKGNTVKVNDKGRYLGIYKVVKYTRGNMLGKPHLKRVQGTSKYPLSIFIKKRN